MAAKRYRWRLEEMLEDLRLIGRYTGGLSFETFQRDPMCMDATVRRLSKLGEATKYLPEALLLEHPNVPWDLMRSVRNFLVHDYFGISERSLWITVQEDLPRLEALLIEVLERWEE